MDYCKEHDTWKLNVAHTIFMQEKKYKDAAAFYEPIVHKKYDDGVRAYLEISVKNFYFRFWKFLP